MPVRNYLDDSYRYTFGGKEEQPELSLDWLDFHARNYMPDLDRTLTMDPLAEKFISLSPYSFLNNNPLRNIDPTGAFTIELTGAAAQDFFERLKSEINSKRDKEKEGKEEEEDRLIFDFDHKSNDCDGCPSTFRYKNREVVTNQDNGKDYLLYDNQWQELPEQKVFEKFYRDPEHPDGGITLERTREQLFIESYVSRTVNYSFFRGALSVGTVTGIVEGIKKPFKRSPLFAILAGAEESLRNAKGLYDRMESHDQEVERNLKSTKK